MHQLNGMYADYLTEADNYAAAAQLTSDFTYVGMEQFTREMSAQRCKTADQYMTPLWNGALY